MPRVRLTKWGNSQGVRIPRELCNTLGAKIGDALLIEYDSSKSAIVLRCENLPKKYARSRVMDLRDFTEGWDGKKIGEEWAANDVGNEVIA